MRVTNIMKDLSCAKDIDKLIEEVMGSEEEFQCEQGNPRVTELLLRTCIAQQKRIGALELLVQNINSNMKSF